MPKKQTLTIMTTIKQLVTVLVFTLLTGELAMAKNFTEAENRQYFISTIPDLTDVIEPLGEVSFTKKSPLKAILYAEQNGNQIELQLTIQNPLDNQWFYKKHDRGDLFKFRDDKNAFLRITYPPRIGGGVPVDPVNVLTDDEYALIEPHEMLTFNFSIPAQLFFANYKRQDIYVYYNNYGLPPSLSELFGQNSDGFRYRVLMFSNQVKVRCYDYNEAQDRYYCDVETLPNLPVFK